MVGDTSAKLRRYFCDALVTISEALTMHPRGISGNGGGGGGEGGRGGGGEGGGRGRKGVDLYVLIMVYVCDIFILFYVHVSFTRVIAFLLSFTLCTVY